MKLLIRNRIYRKHTKTILDNVTQQFKNCTPKLTIYNKDYSVEGKNPSNLHNFLKVRNESGQLIDS